MDRHKLPRSTDAQPLASISKTNNLALMTAAYSKVSDDVKAGKLAGSKVLGTTKDGVRILKPRGKATHFTSKELRAIIAKVRATKPVE